MNTFHDKQNDIVSDGSFHVQTAQLNNALWSYLSILALDYIDFFHGVSYKLFSTGPIQQNHGQPTWKP